MALILFAVRGFEATFLGRILYYLTAKLPHGSDEGAWEDAWELMPVELYLYTHVLMLWFAYHLFWFFRLTLLRRLDLLFIQGGLWRTILQMPKGESGNLFGLQESGKLN